MHQLGNNFFLGCSRHHLHYAKDCNLFQSAIWDLWGKIKCKICTLNYVGFGVPVPFDMQFSDSNSISAMWADTAKLPWKIMEIKPLQMAVASDNLPQSTQKAAPALWKRPLTPPATYSGRYPFSVPVIPVCLIYEYSSVSAFPTMLSIIWARAIFSIWAPVICFLAIVAATFSET